MFYSFHTSKTPFTIKCVFRVMYSITSPHPPNSPKNKKDDDIFHHTNKRIIDIMFYSLHINKTPFTIKCVFRVMYSLTSPPPPPHPPPPSDFTREKNDNIFQYTMEHYPFCSQFSMFGTIWVQSRKIYTSALHHMKSDKQKKMYGGCKKQW